MRKSAILCTLLCLAAPAAFAQDVEALERQLDKAREAAPMTVRNFMLVKRPAKYFGDYEARQDNTYGRTEQFHFYAEPRNLVQKTTNGIHETAVEVDIEFKAEKGPVQKQPKFMSVKIPSRSRVQDLFLNLNVTLGGAPAGKYNVKFIVRDVNSKKSATLEQDIVLK